MRPRIKHKQRLYGDSSIMITLTDNRGKQVVDVSMGHTILVETSDIMTMVKLVRVRVGVTRLVPLTSLFRCLPCAHIKRWGTDIYMATLL